MKQRVDSSLVCGHRLRHPIRDIAFGFLIGSEICVDRAITENYLYENSGHHLANFFAFPNCQVFCLIQQ